MRLRVLNFSAWSADESCDGTTVEPGALETCKQEKPFKAASLSRTRTQRIPSRPGALCSNEGRIHLRRPTCHPHFSLATKRRTIHSSLPPNREPSRHFNDMDVIRLGVRLQLVESIRDGLGNPASRRDARFIAAYSDCRCQTSSCRRVGGARPRCS